MANVQQGKRTRKRKVVTHARFLGGADDLGRRLLLIRHGRDDLVYLTTPILGAADADGVPQIAGFTVEKHDNTGYDVELRSEDEDDYRCECPGYLRYGHCKHCAGLRLAIRFTPEAVGYRHGADQECPF